MAGRLRQANGDRTSATARERLAGNRLHRLQAITEVLARATTPEDVAKATVSAAIEALGADVGGLTIRADDDPGVLRVLVGSALDGPADTGWKRHPTDRPAPGPEIVRTGRPIFVETRDELLARFPIVRRIERGAARYGGFAGVPVAIGNGGPRSTQPRLPSRPHGPAGGTGSPPLDRPPGSDRARPHPVERRRATGSGDRRTRGGSAQEAPGRERCRERGQRPRRARRAGPSRGPGRGARRRHVLPLVVGRRPRPPAQGAGRGCGGSERSRRDPAWCRRVRPHRRDRQASSSSAR